MVRNASMNTRSSSITDSQLGSQAWLTKRASLPSTPASMTVRESTMKRKVWLSFASLASWRRSASRCETRSPRYSMTRVPLGMRCTANTPLPCRAESRTSMRRGNASGLATLHRHRRLDGRVMLVIHELEVLVLVFKNARWPAPDRQCWQRQRRTAELLVRLLQMVQVQVAIAAGPDELARLQVALLRE